MFNARHRKRQHLVQLGAKVSNESGEPFELRLTAARGQLQLLLTNEFAEVIGWDGKRHARPLEMLTLVERAIKQREDYPCGSKSLCDALHWLIDARLDPLLSYDDDLYDPWAPEEVLNEADLEEIRINNDHWRFIRLLERAGLKVHPKLRERYSAY